MPQSNEYMLKQDDAELIYQKKLTAGTNITIDPVTNTISSTGGGGGGSTVSVIPIVTTGTKIATIVVDAIERDLYAPGADVRVTPTVSTGVQIATITIDGTDYYLYAPEGSGGSQVYFGTTDPSDAIGNDKDFYYKLTNLRNTYPVYTHLKMVINANREDDNYTQLSEVNIINTSSNIFDWSGTTVSCSAETGAGDGPENLIDGLTSTKACAETTPTAAAPIEFTFTLGTPIDTEDYQSWRWYTADADSERDPISFDFYGSEDGEVWELLTSATAQEITITREALAYTENFALSVGEISILNRYIKIDDTWVVESGDGGNVDDVTINGASILDEDKIANIPVFDGTTEEDDGVPGLVPSPTAQDTGKVLGSDGTWVDASSIVELKKDDYDDLPSSKESDDILYLLKDISSFSGLYSEKTQQEYDDLPITKNSDDIFYYITDARTIIHNGNIYGGGKTYEAGDHITIVDDVISANYSPFTGATAQQAGAAGLVPAPAVTDVDKVLGAGGNWVKNGTKVEANPADNASGTLTKLGIDGTVYEIQGGGGGSNLILNAVKYSTEEQVVGIWTDGKPLYQKTFERNLTLPSATWVVTGDSIPNGQVVKTEATKIDSISDSVLTWGEIGSDGHIELINIRPVGSVTISHYTMWYTKTTDAVDSGGFQAYGFSPIIYSTEEREVGVWIDNKPLYQKTIVTNNPSVNTNETISVSDLNIDTLVDIEGRYTRVATWASLEFAYEFNCYEANQFNSYLRYSITNDEIQYAIRLGANETTTYQAFTLQYTKTTDTAGSGEYNTLGIPNVHYDGNEKVIGTWFGETLYEKIINFDYNNIQSRTSSGCEIYINVPNIKDTKDSVILFEGGTIQFPYFVSTSIFIGGFTQTETDTLHISLRYSSSVYNELNAYLTDCRVKLQYTKTS